MKKPILIGSIIFAVICIGVGGFVFKTKWMPSKNVPKETPTVTVAPKELILWEDPAGFSFKYPSDLSINKHDEDTENYAHLEFTSSAHTGNIIVWAKDTTNQTVGAWMKNDTTLVGATSIDTTLGGKEAKKIILAQSTSGGKKIITGAIDEDVLVTVEGDNQTDDAFWTEAYSTITQTFAFTIPAGTTDASSQSTVEDNSGSFDEEEVLE